MRATPATLADARALCADGRFHAAASLLLDAFRDAPEDPEVARELGAVLRASGDLDGAVAYLERARDGAPDDPAVIAELVLAYHALQRHQEASRVLIRALASGLRGEDLAHVLRDAA